MTATPKLNLDELAVSIVRCFPTLNLVEQRLSLCLYRLQCGSERAKDTGARATEAGTGDGLHRYDSASGPKGATEATAYGTSDLVPDPSGDAGSGSGG